MRGSPSPRSRRSRPWMRSASSCKVTAATPRPWRSSSSCRSPIPRVWSCAFADVFFLLMLLFAALAALARHHQEAARPAWCLTGKAPSRYPKLVILALISLECQQPRSHISASSVHFGRKTMKFRPLHDRVVVKRLEEELKTKGGIIIPDTAAEKPQTGSGRRRRPGRQGRGRQAPAHGSEVRRQGAVRQMVGHRSARSTARNS